jgi:hypothetical protein
MHNVLACVRSQMTRMSDIETKDLEAKEDPAAPRSCGLISFTYRSTATTTIPVSADQVWRYVGDWAKNAEAWVLKALLKHYIPSDAQVEGISAGQLAGNGLSEGAQFEFSFQIKTLRENHGKKNRGQKVKIFKNTWVFEATEVISMQRVVFVAVSHDTHSVLALGSKAIGLGSPHLCPAIVELHDNKDGTTKLAITVTQTYPPPCACCGVSCAPVCPCMVDCIKDCNQKGAHGHAISALQSLKFGLQKVYGAEPIVSVPAVTLMERDDNVTSATSDLSSQLAKLAELKNTGMLTEDEFKEAKAKAMSAA